MPGHPFYTASPESLESVLRDILSNPLQLQERGLASRKWVEEQNSFEGAYQRKMELYRLKGIV